MVRRKRRVRVITHSDTLPDFEGIQLGRRPIGGHYVLLAASVLRDVADGEPHSSKLDGHIEVPAEKVLLVQVLP